MTDNPGDRHNNPDHPLASPSEHSPDNSESGPTRADRHVYGKFKEIGKEVGLAACVVAGSLSVAHGDNGSHRPVEGPKDHGAEVARAKPNATLGPAMDQQATWPRNPDVGVAQQHVPETAEAAGTEPGIPDQPHVPEPEFTVDPELAAEEPGTSPNGVSGGKLETRPEGI